MRNNSREFSKMKKNEGKSSIFLKKSISSDADKRIQNSSELSIIRDVDSRGNKNSKLSDRGVSN